MARFAGKGALRATRVENEQARVIVVGWDPLSTKTALGVQTVRDPSNHSTVLRCLYHYNGEQQNSTVTKTADDQSSNASDDPCRRNTQYSENPSDSTESETKDRETPDEPGMQPERHRQSSKATTDNKDSKCCWQARK